MARPCERLPTGVKRDVTSQAASWRALEPIRCFRRHVAVEACCQLSDTSTSRQSLAATAAGVTALRNPRLAAGIFSALLGARRPR